jgi:hypothetical protein
MAEKPSWTAIAALIVSVSAVVLSIHQWLVSERNARVKDTVEIANAYLKKNSLPEFNRLILYTNASEISLVEVAQLRLFLYRMEYIAKLANGTRLDLAFIPLNLKCDLYEIDLLIRRAKRPADDPLLADIVEVKKFAPQVSPDCKWLDTVARTG